MYKKAMQKTLKDYPNLSLKAGSVADIVLRRPSDASLGSVKSTEIRGEIMGIRTGWFGYPLSSKSIAPSKVLARGGTLHPL